jgi:hypothetical protein
MNFLKHLVCAGIIASAVVISPLDSRAQSGPPPLPQPMELLTGYLFQDTNFLSIWGDQPLSQTNLALVSTWDYYGLQVDATNAAWLSYTFESDGYPNLFLTNATISCWLVPNWISSGLGGTGSGVWSRILDVGQWTSNASYGWFSLFTDPTGDNIYFSAQSNNGTQTNYLTAPIAWDGTTWHQIVLTYSASSTCLYLDGVLATNGPGISILPPPEALSNGFYVLSDQTGVQQFHGQADRLWIYGNQETDTNEIANDYAYYNAFANPPLHFGSFGDDSPSFPDGDYSGGTNGGSGPTANGIYNPPYGSNDFWLQILPFGTNAYNTDTNSLTFILHGTTADIDYQIQSTTNIQASNTLWTLVGDVFGSDITNYTTMIALKSNLPTLYFRALAATLDSDGDGLPDWWETKYGLSPTNADTGNTGIPDGYKQDSAGDGWDNLQKYQMGIPPNVWAAPPNITGFNVALNSSGTGATLSWNPAPGPVTGYLIQRADPTTNGLGLGAYETIATISATNTSFTDSGSFAVGDVLDTFAPPGSQYQVQAVYGGGDSTPVQSMALGSLADPNLAVNAKLTRGPNGRWLLAFSAIPTNVVSVQISFPFWFYWYDSIGDDDSLDGISLHQTIAVSNLVNGCYTFPDNIITNYVGINEWLPYDGVYNAFYYGTENFSFADTAYEVFVQGVDSSGTNFGPLVYAGVITQDAPYFMDGRQALQESLSFLIQSAGETQPYLLPAETYFYQYFFTNTVGNNFIEHSFIHPALSDKGYGDDGVTIAPVPYIALDNVWPFTVDYLLAGWLYSTNAVPSLNWAVDFTTPSPVLATNGSYQSGPYWIAQDTRYLSDFEITVSNDGTNLSMGSGANNFFGLPQQAALCIGSGWDPNGTGGTDPTTGLPDGGPEIHQLSPSSPVTFNYGPLQYCYSQFTAPVLHTVDYYFAPINCPGMDVTNLDSPIQKYPLPLTPTFAVTNQTPLIIGVVGQPMLIGGWAKQTITNGASGKYAYLGQYFLTNAFKIDTNGTITTNTTGIVSPYGEFLPTEPGPVALITMPDVVTGQQGTCVVQVIKMQLDVNHDGTMDTSWAGPDNTSTNHPFRFWVNNDHDEPANGESPDRDLKLSPSDGTLEDCYYKRMRCQRNLEDFARLWVRGIPALSSNGTATATLYWRNTHGNPQLNMYYQYATDGGTSYLTDTNSAAAQFTQVFLSGQLVFDYSQAVGVVNANTNFTLPVSEGGILLNSNFLFEGASPGGGELVLSIKEGTNTIAEASQWIEIRDIITMYEHAIISPVEQFWPQMVESSSASSFTSISFPDIKPETKQFAVFVHGWRVDPWAAENFAQTMYKRLYWEGYQGGYAVALWPTRSSQTDPWLGLDYATYNRSEHIALESGRGVAAYLNNLRSTYPDYTISVCAHSMGNVVMMESLKELAASSQAPIDNYVLMQAALPAHCYDTTVTNNYDLTNLEATIPTPNAYLNYGNGVTNALRSDGKMINFYNPLDYALAKWLENQSFYLPPDGTNGPITMKPNTFLGYSTTGTSNTLSTNIWNTSILSIAYGGYYNGPTRAVTNIFEVMPFVARPHSLALGAQPGVRGQVSGEINLNSQLGFGAGSGDHSGEFNRNIQDSAVLPFYLDLKTNLFPVQ